MKGFTLIESAIVILLLVLLFGIIFNFNAFNKNIFYLRNQARNLVLALNITSDLSQKIIQKNNNEYYCGYGVYFPNNQSYNVLAFSTNTKLCENVATGTALSNFINTNISNKNYIHQNQDIREDIIQSSSLNTTLKTGSSFIFSKNESCLNNINYPLVLIYIYGYNELFFIAQQTGNSWQKLTFNEIYICLQKGQETFKIKINKLGQVSQVQ